MSQPQVDNLDLDLHMDDIVEVAADLCEVLDEEGQSPLQSFCGVALCG